MHNHWQIWHNTAIFADHACRSGSRSIQKQLWYRPAVVEAMPKVLAAAVLIACLVCVGVVSAQEGGALTDEEARSLYDAGAIAFDHGRFENALDYFERAHALSKRPQLLFNIGVVADRLRMDQRALQAFEQYLQQVPDGAEAANVRARIEVLRRAVAEREKAAQASAPPPAPAPVGPAAPPAEPVAQDMPTAATDAPVAMTDQPRESSRSTLVPWLLIGGGAALAVGGGVLLVVGQGRAGKIEDAEVGTSWSDVEQYEDADAFTGLGTALLAAGAVGAVVGVVLLVSGDDGGDRAPRAQLLVGPGAIGVRGRL
jgi:tetratricopeptide (TPR) repeat protein